MALHNIQKKKSSREKKTCLKGDSNDSTQDLHSSSTFIHSCISLLFFFISFQTHSPPGFVSQSRSKIQHHHHHHLLLLLLLLTLLHKQSIHKHFLLFFNSVQKLTQILYLDLSSVHHHHQYLLLHNFLLLRLSIHEHFLLFFISLQKLARSLAHSLTSIAYTST